MAKDDKLLHVWKIVCSLPFLFPNTITGPPHFIPATAQGTVSFA